MNKPVIWMLILGSLVGIGGPVFFFLIAGDDFSDQQAGPPPVEMAAASARCESRGGITTGEFTVDMLKGNWSGWGDVALEGKQGTYTDTATNAHYGKLTIFAHHNTGNYMAFYHEIARYPIDQQPPIDERDKQEGIVYFYLCADGNAIEGASRASDRSMRNPDVFVPLSWVRNLEE